MNQLDCRRKSWNSCSDIGFIGNPKKSSVDATRDPVRDDRAAPGRLFPPILLLRGGLRHSMRWRWNSLQFPESANPLSLSDDPDRVVLRSFHPCRADAARPVRNLRAAMRADRI